MCISTIDERNLNNLTDAIYLREFCPTTCEDGARNAYIIQIRPPNNYSWFEPILFIWDEIE